MQPVNPLAELAALGFRIVPDQAADLSLPLDPFPFAGLTGEAMDILSELEPLALEAITRITDGR
jgi:hypothetical protein